MLSGVLYLVGKALPDEETQENPQQLLEGSHDAQVSQSAAAGTPQPLPHTASSAFSPSSTCFQK